MSRRKRKGAQSANHPDRGGKKPEQLQKQGAAAGATRAWGVWLLLPAFLLATLAAYHPAWHGGVLWDDDDHLTPARLQSADGLRQIWFDLSATQQYYPVVHSVFWVQHKLWGDDTLGYHLVNIVLHVLSAFLLALILRRLAVPGAILAAAIFALHPVQVESVAWITELKNTLSGALYLAAALAYLHFDKSRQRRLYALALALFVLALLSKTVTATLPAALLIVFWWQRGRLDWRRDVRPLAPFFALGAAGGFLTAWVERTLIGAQGAEFQFTLIERCLIAGRVIWFYLGKLFWPTDLIFIYPRWQVSQDAWWQYLYPLGVAALLAGLWLLRKRSRAPLAAMLFFCGTLFPALGFVNVFPFVYSFVADHFQYLASIGIIALFSAGLACAVKKWNLQSRPAAVAAVLVLGGPLALLSWSQSRQYVDAETLYRATLRRNPSCWMARNNLGLCIARKLRFEEAVTQYHEALQIKPDYPEARNNLGSVLLGMGRLEEAVKEYKEALRLKPDFAEAHYNLGNTFQELGRLDEAAAQYRETLQLLPDSAAAHNKLGNALEGLGRLEEAVTEYTEALRLTPDFAEAHNQLGDALRMMGRPEEAMAQYNQALRINRDYPEAHNNLGIALQGLGRLDEAAAQYRAALRLKPDLAEAHNNLGDTLQKTGRFAEAMTHFREAVRLKPDYANAYYNLGNVLSGMGRFQEAVEQYRLALKYNPADAAAHNNLGAALGALGSFSEAAAQYEEALRIRPDFAQARANLAKVLTMIRRSNRPAGR